MTFDLISACIVTRGDVDLAPILETLPYGEVIIWDNSTRPADLKTFGRFAAAAEATNDVVYFQDDDTLFHDHEALLRSYVPGTLTAVYGHGENPAGYEDIAIFPGGALVDKALTQSWLDDYLRAFTFDDDLLYYCDYVFGCLTPHVQLHLPFDIRDVAYNGRRLADEPWARDSKARIAAQARSLR